MSPKTQDSIDNFFVFCLIGEWLHNTYHVKNNNILYLLKISSMKCE